MVSPQARGCVYMAIISYPALFFPPLTTIKRNDRSPRQVVIFFCSIGPSQIAAALKRHTVMSYLRPNIFLVRNSDIVVFSVEGESLDISEGN